MSRALTFLLTGSLLQGVLCGEWRVNIPQTVQVLSGSCVTIPCSFDIVNSYEKNFNDKCQALWTNEDPFFNENAKLTPHKKMTANLTSKDCTTTFNNMNLECSSKYYFRLDCNNELKYTFKQAAVNILVKADPPSPTLTPSTLEVKEGTSVSVMCSAPAPCWSHPPTLTWTPNLGDSVETLQENQDKTKVMTSVLNFTASHHHHRKKISCSAVCKKQDGSADASAERSLTAVILYSPKNTTVSVSTSHPVPEDRNMTLTCSSNSNLAVKKKYTWYRANENDANIIEMRPILNTEASKMICSFFGVIENELQVQRSNLTETDIQFPPQILLSSDCIKTPSQVNCSCETVGNPSPTVQWYSDGLPVSQSGKFEIISETSNNTALRSIIIMNQPQKGNISTLLCRSFNSMGSASQQFCVRSHQISEKDPVLYLASIATLTALLLLLCVLLFVTRAKKRQHDPPKQMTRELYTNSKRQSIMMDENEGPSIIQESIYANMDC